MKLNRLNGVVYGLLLGLSAVGQQAQATDAHDALTGRLAELHIVDRTAGHRLPVYWHHGKAYVVGNPGNEYEISLSNRISGDVMAVVSVDGVNVLSGQTASSQQSGYVYKSGESYSILGWRKSREQTAAFYFTSLSDSYAGRTGRPNDVGVIGVALFQRKPKPVAVAPRRHISESKSDYSQLSKPIPPPPGSAPEFQADQVQELQQMPEKQADSLVSARRAAPEGSAYPRQSERLGTGHGRIEDSPVRFVEFERATSKPAEVLTIYYDSYANLVARGIVPRYRTTCEGSSRYAGCNQPFPGDLQTGFVPDPPR
jgi:hypothetical protein